MDLQKMTEEYRMSEWVRIIKERIASGDNINKFCEERGISRHAYFYWQRKLRKAACTELARQDTDTESPSVPVGWMRLSPAAETKPSLRIEVSGCHIDVNNQTDLELLKTICRTLRAL